MSEQPELTTTIHLSALRSVPKPRPLEEIFSQLTSDERTVVGGLAHGDAMLIVIAGASRGARFLIDSTPVTIGRSTSAEIMLDDVTVSRSHAKIEKGASGHFELTDLDSLNGSYLNGTAVKHALLTVGDEIQIGKYRLTFFTGKGNS
jgi:pSer/pThr/pTyr-binding forkhead associated (FHA) protein